MKNLCELVFVTVTRRLFTVRSILFFVFIAVLSCGTVQAQGKGFGLGIIVDEPTGITTNLWIGKSSAIDAEVAWSQDEDDFLYLHGDFLFHNLHLSQEVKGKFLTYYGIGVKVEFADSNKVGLRIPLGIDYIFPKAPLDVFFEVVPLLELVPATESDLKAAVGIRFVFGKGNSD
ncbi:MAG: hypothetical protein MUO91_07610 [candidate division Zixibacteria bacterium]|nr:hypothetical protein [candidate division Zixibacteria bacterium]